MKINIDTQGKIVNTLKLIFINIISIVLILIVIDWCLTAYVFEYKEIRPASTENLLDISERFEQPLAFDSTKPSIMVIGCSFVYGTMIEQSESFPYKLQQLTKRKVYNYGTPGQGVQHLLYKIQNSPFWNYEKTDPEYVIYVFIEDHIRRLYKDFRLYEDVEKYLRYPVYKKNGKKYINPLYKPSDNIEPMDYWRVTQLGKKINEFFYIERSDNQKFDLLKLYLLTSKKILKQRHPNTKLAVIVYNSKANTEADGSKPFTTSRWNELEESGIKVINFQTDEYDFLTTPEYTTSEIDVRVHPSGRAWDILTPIIIKELGIK